MGEGQIRPPVEPQERRAEGTPWFLLGKGTPQGQGRAQERAILQFGAQLIASGSMGVSFHLSSFQGEGRGLPQVVVVLKAEVEGLSVFV